MKIKQLNTLFNSFFIETKSFQMKTNIKIVNNVVSIIYLSTFCHIPNMLCLRHVYLRIDNTKF